MQLTAKEFLIKYSLQDSSDKETMEEQNRKIATIMEAYHKYLTEPTESETIVAEISKTWFLEDAGTRHLKTQDVRKPLCVLFEEVIKTNDYRGYKLLNWQLNTTALPDQMTETIIAVFVKK